MEWKEIEKLFDIIYSGKKYGNDIEGQFLELKKCPKNIKEVIFLCRELSVCFANADGGTLVLGVEDRIKGPHAFSGCPDFDTWEITKGVRNGTQKPVIIQVVYHVYQNVNLIEIIIPKGPYEGAHALNDGRQTTRRGADCIPLLPTTTSPKFVQVEEYDYSRSIVPNLIFDDLDKKEIKTIRDIIKMTEGSQDFLKIKDDIDFLKALRMIQEEKNGNINITLAAVLFAGKEEIIKKYIPQSELIFMSYDKNGEVEAEQRFNVGLLSMILNFQDYYNKNYNPVHHLDTGLFEIKIPKVPDQVLRESLLNSVTHRDYHFPSSIFFYDYPDRIELINPGDFCGDITPENILTHIPFWRNRLISEIFQYLGLVRRMGIGVDRIYRYLLNAGKNPPIYQEGDTHISLIIYNEIDENFAKYLEKIKRKKYSISLEEMITISALKKHDKITTKEGAVLIQRSVKDAKNLLDKMYHDRKLDRFGTGTGQYYRLSANLYTQLGDSLGYYRNGQLEKSRYKQLIIDALRDKGKITNDDTQQITGQDRVHSYQLLNELVIDGIIELKGKGRASHYQLKIK